MKIIETSNFDLESIVDTLVAENIQDEKFGLAMCDGLNAEFSGDSATMFYKLVQDDYRLSRGMEDLV